MENFLLKSPACFITNDNADGKLFISDDALGQIIILLLLSLVTLRYLNMKFLEYKNKKINIKSIIINISTIMYMVFCDGDCYI